VDDSTRLELQARSADYTLWSKEETYFETCRKHYIGNHTWGEPLTKFVDKANVKSLVEAMNIDGLKIPKTLKVYNEGNISELTLEAMRQIPQPYIIKPTHIAGSVSRVKNDKWSCIKGCDEENEPIGKETREKIVKKSMEDLALDFSAFHNELQYKDVPHQIIVEEDISNEIKTDVSYWYTSNRRPLFVSVQCSPTEGEIGTHQTRAFVTLNFERLNLRLLRSTTCPKLVRPSNWEKQVEVATALAKGVPGILRIDLYPGESSVFFSEFTYTTAYCDQSMGFRPRVADGLLHAFQYGAINPAVATPELVESIIHDTSWVFVTLVNGRTIQPETSGAFPSPVDLCEFVSNDHIEYTNYNWQNDEKVNHCLTSVKEVTSAPLRCVVSSDNDSSPSSIVVLSDEKQPTLLAVGGCVDWGRALTLFLAITILSWMNIGTKREKNQYVNNILYLIVLLIYMRLFVPRVKSTFSNFSIVDIAKQSFAAFAYVHPMESPHIALSHFATYWVLVASWRSKSLRSLLFWQCLYEVVVAIVNESSHMIEDQDIVHCARVAFKTSVRSSAFDDVLRVYVLPPFFVYGYLLPNFIIYWVTVPVLSIGAALLSLFWIYKL
jgi:hypothetical protein